MKPKLLVLNGPCGIGKSTLAMRYAQDHPMTLQLDIDNVWSMFSSWREHKDRSGPLSKKVAIEMARVSLLEGCDVVVPQIIQNAELADEFKNLANSTGSEYQEVLLMVEKNEAIKRFIDRGIASGYPTGFSPGGVLQREGGVAKLSEMYDNMMRAIDDRNDIIAINPKFGDIESTYALIVKSLQ